MIRLASHPLSLSTVVALWAASTGCGSSGQQRRLRWPQRRRRRRRGGNDATTGGNGGHDASGGGSDGNGGGSDANGGGSDATRSGAFLTIPLDVGDQLHANGAGVNVGGQSFEMLLDTGSTTLGVAGTGCTNCAVTPLYTPGSTATNENQTITETFGSGSPCPEMSTKTLSPSRRWRASPPWAEGSRRSPRRCRSSRASRSRARRRQASSGFDVGQAAQPCGSPPRIRSSAPTASSIRFIAAYPTVANEFCAAALRHERDVLWLGGTIPTATTGAPQYTSFLTAGVDAYYYSGRSSSRSAVWLAWTNPGGGGSASSQYTDLGARYSGNERPAPRADRVQQPHGGDRLYAPVPTDHRRGRRRGEPGSSRCKIRATPPRAA